MPLNNTLRAAAMGILLTAVGGCSALTTLQSASKPLNTFELSPLAAGSVPASRGSRYLEVALPTATGALTSDRIVIKPTPHEVQSLPGSRWVNETNQHVQLLLVRSLANSGRFALVSQAGSGPPPDYVLLTDLRAFQAEVGDDGVSVVIHTTMTLLRASDGSVISARSFTNTVPASGTSTEKVVTAFDMAMTQQLTDVVGWLVRNSGA